MKRQSCRTNFGKQIRDNAMAITQQSKATDGQVKQISRFGSDAIDKVLVELGLDNPGAQRVIEHGDEFTLAIRNAALASIKDLSVSDKYKNEEVKSKYGYLSGYKPKSVVEQHNILQQLFPKVIGIVEESIAEGQLPAGAEGWFVIPKWQNFASTYGEAVEVVLDTIKQTRGKFYNYLEGQLGSEYLRQSARTEKLFQQLSEAQGNPDLLVVPGQFGLNHRGRSVRRVREVFTTSEFGLGALAVGIMILTHPERLQNVDDLWIDCAGDEYTPDADGDFSEAPDFRFDDDEVKFDAEWLSHAYEHCGSASAFLPQ